MQTVTHRFHVDVYNYEELLWAFIWAWGLGFPWAIENLKHGHLRSDILTLSGKFKSQDFLFLFPYPLQNSESQLDQHIRF